MSQDFKEMEYPNLAHFSSMLTGVRLAVTAAATVLLAACVTPPPRTYTVPGPAPQRVFVYPANGQSAEQTDRDRYECHVWAVQQTGVDPSRADASAYERVVVQPANPPGSGTAVGLIGGAILGSIIGGPQNAGAGAIMGWGCLRGIGVGAGGHRAATAQGS